MAVDKSKVPLSGRIGRRDEVRAGPPPEALAEVVFGPTQGWSALNLRELWQHRELLYFLVWRDLKVRYKQTALGAAWAIIKPVMTMVVFSAIFGTLLAVPSGGLPYPVFAYAALLPWALFASGVTQAGSSLVANAHLISKVYFPRLVVPLATVLGATVDFAVAFAVLVALMLFYGIVPGAAIVALPLFLLLALLATLGCGLWLAALQVRYRDIGHLTPFLIQLGLFVTPVAYPASLVPEGWQLLYSLNPLAVVVEGFRWTLLGAPPVPWQFVASAATVVVAVCISGLFFFRRTERDFADIV